MFVSFRMVLCETSMLSLVFGIMLVSLNPGLQRARSLWSGASDNLIMHVFPAKREFMQPSQSCKMAEGSSSSCTLCERAVSIE